MRRVDVWRMESGASSVSTLHILAGIVLLLLVIIMLAWLLAPERPVAPPSSRMSYEAPPPHELDTGPPFAPLPEGEDAFSSMPAADLQPAQDAMAPEEAPEIVAHLQGKVTDRDTSEVLPEVEVRVELQRWETPPVNPAIDHWQSVNTDTEGAYRVPLPGAGSYTVTYVHPDYVRETITLEVAADDRDIERNIQLRQGARISGRVTEEGSGSAAPEVTVRVEEVYKSAVTDETGNYEIRGLELGEHSVFVPMEGIPYLSGRELPYQRVNIRRADEHVRNVDFRLAPAGTVWGYVMTPEEEPVEAMVLLTGTESIMSQALNAVIKPERFLAGNSDSEGYYELVGVPLNEQWRIYAASHNESHAPQLVEPFILSDTRREARIDIFLFPGTNIRGQVRDTHRNPVEGAEVVCIPAFSQLLGPLDRAQAFSNATTDAEGYFEITQVPSGNYQLYPFKDGYKFSTMGQAVYPDGYSDLEGVTLTLLPLDEGRYSVYGTVVDSNDRAISGAQVSLAGVSTESFNALDRSTSTDGQGGFQFDGVETGSYQLTATREGYARRSLSQVRLNQPNEIVLAAASILRGQVLVRRSNQPPESYTVSAQPTSGSGMLAGFGGATAGPGSWSGSDPSGRFELSLAAGEYRLEATAPNYVPGRTEVSVAAGEVQDGITVYLEDSGASLAGQVTTSDGSSPQGTEVLLIESGSADQALAMMAGAGGGADSVQVGADGAFEFTMLPAGDYMVMARHQNYAPASAGPFYLESGDHEEDVAIELGAGGALEGYVYRDGRPVEGAMVVVLAGGQPFTATVDGEGYYYLDGLSEGTHQAIYTMSDAGNFMGLFNTRGVMVEIETGQVTRQDFGTGEGALITGICSPPPASFIGGRAVLRQPGFPTANLGDFVNVDQVLGNSTGVDSSGYFEFENVPVGDWQLDVYYFEVSGAIMSSMRYVHTEIVSLTPEDTEINLDIALSAY